LTDLVSGITFVKEGRDLETESQKVNKSGRVRWVGEMNQALLEGLAASAWLAQVESDQMAAGRQICLDLWPFIKALPDNIKAVKDKLPESLEPAKLFLSNLADEERHYQELYLKQCQLAGLSREDLTTSENAPSPATQALLEAISQACAAADVVTGVQAIVAAELAATHFARAAKDAFEHYFSLHSAEYSSGEVDGGLAWLRLHAKTNTLHALWMNRMLVALHQDNDSLELPPTVEKILQAIFALWHVDQAFNAKRCQAEQILRKFGNG